MLVKWSIKNRLVELAIGEPRVPGMDLVCRSFDNQEL